MIDEDEVICDVSNYTIMDRLLNLYAWIYHIFLRFQLWLIGGR